MKPFIEQLLRTGFGNFPADLGYDCIQNLLCHLFRRSSRLPADVGHLYSLKGYGLWSASQCGDVDIRPAILDNKLVDAEFRFFPRVF
jgi:hypothetical protein